jgi:hypothetical protein
LQAPFMITTIKTRDLRTPAGSCSSGFRLYLPKLFSNGDYVLPPRNSSILKGLMKFKRSIFKEDGRLKLKNRLQRDFGLSGRMSEIFAARSPAHIRRIEQTIEGIVDSLLLFDPDLLISVEGLRTMKHIVRKIMKSGTFNLPDVISQWKTFTAYTFLDVTRSYTKESHSIPRGNAFAVLRKTPLLSRMLKGEISKDDLSKISHLCSTRQLPCGDRKVEIKSLNDLKQLTSSSANLSAETLKSFYEGSRIIGRKCRKAGPGPIRNAHLSLATSGSLDYKVHEGGRAQEISDFTRPILEFTPETDVDIVYPLGVLKDRAGIPRWRTWCREDVLTLREGEPLGSPHETLAGFFDVFRLGFDEAMAEQILACAFLAEMQNKEEDIPLRVLTITEPGSKARIVTTGPWWVYVLQQPLAHVSRGFLGSHPSCEAGMMRTDQAWQYLHMLEKVKDFLPGDFEVLSSDLKSATDTICPKLATSLLRGFFDGLGYTSPLVEVNLRLLSNPRLCISEKIQSIWRTYRGVFMGEPLAKTILTLAVTSAEEIALRRFLKIGFDKPIQVPWRAFADAGDDHIASGPVPYLDEIGSTLIEGGMIISSDKHARSRLAVRFCEKVLDIRNIKNPWSVSTINDSNETYQASPFVDSIKVRLLSPCSKSNESFNDRNTAVGKGKSLGRTLRWLSPSVFPHKWIRMVRDRFFQRMGSLLPDSTSGVYWHLLLPEHLGGLGLYIDADIPDLLYRIPGPTKSLIKDYPAFKVEPDAEILRMFVGFTSNISYRGYSLLEDDLELIKTVLLPELKMSDSFTMDEALLRENLSEDLSTKSKISRLRGRGYLTAWELDDRVTRPFLFKQILSKEAKVSAFNTESFKRRYQKLWDITFRGSPSITERELRYAISNPVRDESVYYLPETDIFVNGQIKKGTILEELTAGLPNFGLRWSLFGELGKAINLASEEAQAGDDFSLGEYV